MSCALSIMLLYLAFRLSLSFFIILAICKLLCACYLVEFAMVDDSDKMRALSQYYHVTPNERMCTKAVPSAILFLTTFAVALLASGTRMELLDLSILLALVIAFSFCWAAALGASLQMRRATPLWQVLHTALPLVPIFPWILGVKSIVQQR